MPKDVTVDMVDKVYRKAYEVGCKGVTVYRDGSRSGVLVDSKQENKKTPSKKRPELLPCEIHNTTIHGVKWKIVVGLNDGKPYEVFAYEAASVDFPKSLKRGYLRKATKGGKKIYNLLSEDKKSRVVDLCDTQGEIATAVCLPIAALLASGSTVEYVVKVLDKIHGDITSFAQGIKRVLMKFMKEGNPCPECGETMSMTEGCMTCPSCGHSRCG